jgi:type IV pilus assembly protein PilB
MENAVKGDGRQTNKRRLGDVLVETGLLTERHIQHALDEQRKIGKRLGEILIERQMISEKQIAQSLADQLGLAYVDPTAAPIDPALLFLIPEALAKRHLAVPLEVQNKKLKVAMVDPLDYESINDLQFQAGMAIHPAVATRRALLEAIEQNYRLDSSVEKIVEASAKDFGGASIKVVSSLEEGNLLQAEVRSLEEKSRLAPVIQLANLILSKAIKLQASDIHIESGTKDCRVRYRIDGLLEDAMHLPKWVQNPLISRIKILAKLDIAERRLPQDGAVRVVVEGHEVDLRVSILPTLYGEKVVLRILDQARILIQLDQIGLDQKSLQTIRQMIKKKKGMILVTGPTGSGKTTTLYAIINELKSKTKNLTTVEDPVEYTIEGVNQVQIHSEIGLTFAAALRSILRQDPNIILIGEIRDLETAEIAFRAAMTGHLVLATLHTNDAISTITRLIDIGIPRYLVSSAVVGIVAQRLVRKLCLKCRVTEGTFFQEKGCSSCHYTGFSGRCGIFEVLTLSPKLRELIAGGTTEQEIRSVAAAFGMGTLEEDGLQKVKQGVTTKEEVIRVVEMEEAFIHFCPQCSRSLHLDYRICPYCGAASPYVCPSCGKFLQPEWNACPYCREPVRRAPGRHE